MPSSGGRLVIAVVALLSTIGAYWFTFQPTRPLGSIPVFIWVSDIIIAGGALMLGRELSSQIERTDRLVTFALQLVSLLCLATIGIGAGYLADPDWWDYGVTRVYYFFALAPGVLLISLSHAGALLLARIRATPSG